MIKCKACNYDNPIGRVHCGQCGAKLDLSSIVTSDQATGAHGEVVVKVQKAGGGFSIGRAIRKLISLVILAVLVVMGALAWQQTPLEEVKPDAALALAVKGKIDTLMQAQERGEAVTVIFSGEEINSYLSAPGSPKCVACTPDNPAAVFLPRWAKYQVEIGQDRLTAAAVGEVRVSQLTKEFIFRSSGAFVEGAGGKKLKWTTAFIGRLPLHALPGGEMVAQIVGDLCFQFPGFDAEWKLLREARAITLTHDSAVVGVGPAR